MPETMEMTIEATNPEPKESITNPGAEQRIAHRSGYIQQNGVDNQVEHAQRKYGYREADKLEEGLYGHVQQGNNECHYGNGTP